MHRPLLLLVIAFPIFAGCGELPAPAQYDRAMLREYFGASPEVVKDTFGSPSSVTRATPPPPTQDATDKDQVRFRNETESMSHLYSTPDGDLVIRFNLDNQVFAITYAGNVITPPEADEAETVGNSKSNQ